MLPLNSKRVLIVDCTFLLLVSPAFAGIVVLAGGGGAGVRDSDGDAGQSVPWTQTGPASLAAQWRELYISGSLEITAQDDLLTLSFEGAHSIRRTTQESRSEMISSIGGGLWIMSDVDVLVSASGEMTFSLHGQEDPGAGLQIEIADQNQDLIHQKFVSSAYGPPNGTISLVDSVFLDGETQYFIFISGDLSQVAVGFSGIPSTATSEMTLAIQAVPEPATLVLVGIASVFAVRRPSRKPAC